jgi:hypothetical protein
MIVISAIDQAGLLQIRNTPHTDTAYAQLVTVLQVPSGEGQAGMEVPVAGKIKVTKNALLFIPSRPFVRGGNYQVTTYLNSQFGNTAMLVKGKLSYRVKPQQVTLVR